MELQGLQAQQVILVLMVQLAQPDLQALQDLLAQPELPVQLVLLERLALER
jgi:hypothetical protein